MSAENTQQQTQTQVFQRQAQNDEQFVIDRPFCTERPSIDKHVYRSLTQGDKKLVNLIWEQHRYHEYRRWNVMDYVRAIDLNRLNRLEQHFIKNAGFAELTTKPGADRLTRLSDKECRRWLEDDENLAAAIQACGTWSRYWNEEESHHEMSFNYLSLALNAGPAHDPAALPPDDEEIIEFRKIFPDDDMLRTLTLLAFSEVNAAVSYYEFARKAEEPNLKAMLHQISADEVQHMHYFVTFAKALVDSGRYHPKNAFAIGHLFLREGGELYGSTRVSTESRGSHVNWWDAVDGEIKEISVDNGIERKEKMILKALENITGIKADSRQAVENTWMDMLAA